MDGSLPLLLAVDLLAVALLVAVVVSGRRPAWIAPVAVVAAVSVGATGASGWSEERARATAIREGLLDETPPEGIGDGIAGSDACRSCHPGQYASWHRTFHRTMTTLATPENVKAQFSGTIENRGLAYALSRRGDEFWVNLVDPDVDRVNALRGVDVARVADAPRVDRRVVMVTGSHHMQTYWLGSRFGRELLNLPFVWLYEQQRWVPREDVFLRPPGAGRFSELWNDNCIECHSTVGVPGLTPESEAFDTRAAELGIACEACHGPAAEHVAANRDPLRRYRLHLADGGDPTIVQPERLPARRAGEVCGQCHGVALSDARRWLAAGPVFRAGDELEEGKFLVLPARNADHPRMKRLVAEEPWALRSRFWPDGMVRVSGREYTGMVESPCVAGGEYSCLSCHSMHSSDPDDQLAAGMDGNRACTQCHPAIAGRLTEHTRHAPGSSGSSCYNCHMPHTTYGLLKTMRSHQVDSPSVAAELATGRPNACNLCHLDRTLEWTAGHLESWYGQPRPALDADRREIADSILWLLRGDAGQRALAVWHMGWEPALEASGRSWMPPYLGHALGDPYAVVRYIAERSLRQRPEYATMDYDYVGPAAEIARARHDAIQLWMSSPPASVDRLNRHVLIDAAGNLDFAALERLTRERDDRPLFLGE